MASYQQTIELVLRGEERLKKLQSRVTALNKEVEKIKQPTAKAGTNVLADIAKEAAVEQKKYNNETNRTLLNQIKLNSAVDLYQRRLKAVYTTAAPEQKQFQGRLEDISRAFNVFKDQKNVAGVQAVSTELGRIIEYSNEIKRSEIARVKSAVRLREYIAEINRLKAAGLNVSKAEKTLEQVKVDLGTNRFRQAGALEVVLKDRLKLLKQEEQQIRKNRQEAEKRTGTSKTGTAGLLEQAGAFGLGAGFPLLFGGGVGQVAGGAMGTAIAQAFGLAGEAAMGLQIALSAVAGKVEELVTRFREIGNATRVLDLDALEQSSITVNAELRQLVRRLVEAGESGAALSVVTAKVAEQTGIIPSKTADITRSVNKLSNEWDGTLSAVSGLVSILSQPFVDALTQILRLVNQTTKGANVLLQLLSEGVNRLNPFHPLLKLLNKDTEDIVESEQKRLDLLRQSSDKLELEYNRNKALFDIESKRTAGKTVGEKLINAELERNKKLKELEFATDDKIKQNRKEYGDLTSKQAQIELNYSEMLIEKNAKIEEQKINQTYELEKQNIQYESMQEKLKDITEKGEAQKRNIKAQETAYKNSMSVVDARLNAEKAVNDLHNQQLERAYEIAGTARQRLEIAKVIYQNEVKGAELVYQKTLNQIEAEQKALEFKRQSAVIDAQVLKARGDMLIAERKGDAATRARVQKSIDAQVEVIRLIDEQITTQAQVAGYQKEAADAQFRAAELTARQNLEQKLVSDEIDLSQQEAYNLSGRLSDGAINAHNLKTGMGQVKSNTQGTVTMMIRVATEADRAANSIARAAAQQQALNAAKAQSGGGGSSSPPAYAKGGFVNGAQMALVGEGGPEYIVPEKKAAAFATNYLMGARGSAAIPRYAEGGYVGSVSIQTGPVTQMDGTNYVTTGDLSMAVQAGIRQTLDLIRRDGNTRASLGLS